MPTLKLAKRSAAFEAIKKLYEYGELSENLMPYNRQKCLERFDKVYFDTWTEFKNGILKQRPNKFQNILCNAHELISIRKTLSICINR